MWLRQIAFMRALTAEGAADTHDIVFLDMDVLVVDSLSEVSIPAPAISLFDHCWGHRMRVEYSLTCAATPAASLPKLWTEYAQCKSARATPALRAVVLCPKVRSLERDTLASAVSPEEVTCWLSCICRSLRTAHRLTME